MSYLKDENERVSLNLALHIERGVPEEMRELYLECMNGKPMSARKTPAALRDGCALSHVYIQCSTDKLIKEKGT